MPNRYSVIARLRQTVIAAVLSGVGGLLVSGCMSTPSLQREMEAARQVAYEDWSRRRTEQKESEAFLKGKLSLEDAVKVSIQNNKSLQAAMADKEVARGQVLESWSSALPRVRLSGNYSRRDSRGVPPVGFLDSYSTDLEVTQPLFRGGQIPAALRAARLYALLSDESLRGQVQQVIFNVRKSYYDALKAQHLYDVDRDAVLSAEAQLRDTKLRMEQGVATEFEVLRAEVDVANFKADMIREKNNIQLARAELLKTMGVSQESEIEFSDQLEYLPMKPVFEKAVEFAYLNRPDLFANEMNVRLQEEAVRIARSEYFPRISAFYRRTWANPDPVRPLTDDEWGNSWIAGGQAEMTLFDGFGREGRLKQEVETLKKRHVELLDAQEQALLDVQRAILSLRNAEELVESQNVNVRRANKLLELTEKEYREGASTQVKVTDARAALTRAHGNYYEAVYAHSMARLSLQLAMGVLGPAPGQPLPPESGAQAVVPLAEVDIFETAPTPAAEEAAPAEAQPAP